MGKRLTLFSFVVLTITFSVMASAQFEHPAISSHKTVLHSVLILPPQVTVTQAGVKSKEPLFEEGRRAEGEVPELIRKMFEDYGCKVLENPFSAENLKDNPDLSYALADIQKRFDDIGEQLDKKPKDVRKGRFTLGDQVATLNPRGAADALIFVRGAGAIPTGGKQAFAALSGGLFGAMATSSRISLYIAVVDAHSGDVLYYGRTTAKGNFVEEPDIMDIPIRKSFKNFAGPEGTKKTWEMVEQRQKERERLMRTRTSIELDRTVQVGGTDLTPGLYKVVFHLTERDEGELYFYRGNKVDADTEVAATAPVEMTTQGGEATAIDVVYGKEGGVAKIAEIRTPTMSFRFL